MLRGRYQYSCLTRPFRLMPDSLVWIPFKIRLNDFVKTEDETLFDYGRYHHFHLLLPYFRAWKRKENSCPNPVIASERESREGGERGRRHDDRHQRGGAVGPPQRGQWGRAHGGGLWVRIRWGQLQLQALWEKQNPCSGRWENHLRRILWCKTVWLSLWRSIEDAHLHTDKHAVLHQRIRLWFPMDPPSFCHTFN